MGLTASTDSLARDDLVEKLDQSSRQAPRFLYRGWSDASCGGIPGLNTPERITPLAFLKDPSRPVQHLGQHPQARDLIHNHGCGSSKLLTEFSSWTDSWTPAWDSATRGSPGSAHISIVDRERLGRPANFYHLDDLYELGLAPSAGWEWLAHGVVKGEGLQTRALYEMRGTTEDGHLQFLEMQGNLPAELLSEPPLQISGLECSLRRNYIERATVLMQKLYFSGPTSGQYQVLLYSAIVEKIGIAVGNSRSDMQRRWNHIYSFMRGLLKHIDKDECGFLGTLFAEKIGLGSDMIVGTDPGVISGVLAMILEEPMNSWMIGEDRHTISCI